MHGSLPVRVVIHTQHWSVSRARLSPSESRHPSTLSLKRPKRGSRPCCRYPNTPPGRGARIMLTTTAATVKFPLPMTPEHTACSRKIDEGLQIFWSVVEQMQH